jgi:hypothetical protein
MISGLIREHAANTPRRSFCFAVKQRQSSGNFDHRSACCVAQGTWRQLLPAMPASKTAYDLSFASNSPLQETAEVTDVLFGDVFLCGGQSNMEFSMAAVANRSLERQAANDFPTIRFFSVGHRTASPTPLRNLQTVWEPWQVGTPCDSMIHSIATPTALSIIRDSQSPPPPLICACAPKQGRLRTDCSGRVASNTGTTRWPPTPPSTRTTDLAT